MSFKSDLNEIASILDEDILKSERRRKRSRIEHYEESITKSLSHDPFDPHEMGPDSPYYNPYMQTEMGWMPYSKNHWEGLGKETSAGQYLTTQRLYDELEGKISAVSAFSRSFAKSELMKSGLPVGTVHTYSDGQRYKKIAEGRWTPVAGLEKKAGQNWLEHPDEKKRMQANQSIEQHAGRAQAIRQEMKSRERDQKTIGEAKRQSMSEAINVLRTAMSKLYDDGKEPTELKKIFDTVAKQHADPNAEENDPKKKLGGVEDHVRGGKKHNVTVNFKVGDKAYTHTFKDVAASGHSEATNKVLDGMKAKFGGAAQISGIKAESVKEPKQENGAAPEAKPQQENANG